MKITVTIPPNLAPPLELPGSVTVERGQRARETAIPANMLANFAADEARAWAHSDLAGALWESGFRASRSIKLADSSK